MNVCTGTLGKVLPDVDQPFVNHARDIRARTKSMKEPSVFEISFRLHDPDEPENSCAPRGEPRSLTRITQVLALAIHFENMLREGEAEDYAHIGRLTGMCRERISQIMRLNYLAPAIQVELLVFSAKLTGRYPISEAEVRKIANLLSWNSSRNTGRS